MDLENEAHSVVNAASADAGEADDELVKIYDTRLLRVEHAK
jgi:hypothetical protein